MGVTLTIVGNLGSDPEMRYTPKGTAVANVSIATNRKYPNAEGEKIEETTWWRISFWGKRAEAANQYLKKGMPVEIHGRLRAEPEVYQRKDGSWATSYEVTAINFEFVATGGGGGGEYQGQSQVEEPEDIPF